ncbi:hypothetical protein J2X47_000334 [Sphingomonas sp. BE270]|nr:hypothetical protein [Sphingomonas sp. BE137]MDR7256173.1 hypothetical protein [Sphingomonas sp. BE270]
MRHKIPTICLLSEVPGAVAERAAVEGTNPVRV